MSPASPRAPFASPSQSRGLLFNALADTLIIDALMAVLVTLVKFLLW